MMATTMDPRDYVSDDDFEPPARRNPRAGIKMIEKLAAADWQANRRSASVIIKSLQVGNTAPGTRAGFDKWINEFDCYRASHYGQDRKTPFSVETMMAFIINRAQNTKARSYQNELPNLSTFVVGAKCLIAYGFFEHATFKWEKHHAMQMKACLDGLVDPLGLAIRGKSAKRIFISCMVLMRMAIAWLDHAEKHGTRSWDVVLLKLLAVVLISALGVRVGDVTRSALYTGCQYAVWRDVRVRLADDPEVDPGRPRIQDIELIIELRWMKEHKQEINDGDEVRFLRPLADPRWWRACPVSLLLIHAMRHGLVKGAPRTMADFLALLRDGPANELEWTHPDAPVLCSQQGRYHLDVHRHLEAKRVNVYVQEIAIRAGLLSPINIHASRRGWARDNTHRSAEQKAATGVATLETAAALGHTNTAFLRGVTALYTGGPTVAFFNQHVGNEWVDPLAPKFAADPEQFVRDVEDVSREEAIAWMQEHRPEVADPTTKVMVRCGRRNIRAQRIRDALARKDLAEKTPMVSAATARPAEKTRTAAAEPGGSLVDPPDPPPVDPRLADPTAASTARCGRRNVGTQPAETKETLAGKRRPSTPGAARPAKKARPTEPAGPNTATYDDDAFYSMDESEDRPLAERSGAPVRPPVDPRLLVNEGEDEGEESDEEADLDAARANPADVDALAELMLGRTDGSDEVDIGCIDDGAPATITALELDCLEALETAPEADRAAVIDGLAVANEVRCSPFSKAWGKVDGASRAAIQACSEAGNSRNPPTPFLISCGVTPGCRYKHFRALSVQLHEKTCTEAGRDRAAKRLNTPRTVPCRFDGCGKFFADRPSMEGHFHALHKWTPRACDVPGCALTKIFNNKTSLELHKERAHLGRWPSKCLHPDCAGETRTYCKKTYRGHLTTRHKLGDTDARAPYMPPSARAAKAAAKAGPTHAAGTAPKQQRWPARCLHPDCRGALESYSEKRYRQHLEDAHGLSSRGLAPRSSRPFLAPTRCLHPDCRGTLASYNQKQYSWHLEDAHGLESKSARIQYFPPPSAQ